MTAFRLEREADPRALSPAAGARVSRAAAAPLRVCVVGLRGAPSVIGGIETHCEQLYPRLHGLDPSVDVVFVTRRGYATGLESSVPGVAIHPVWAPKVAALETFAHTFIALLVARARLHPQVMHLHGIGPAFFAPLSKLLGFQTIVTHHAQDYFRPRWRWLGRRVLRSGETAAALFADAIICVSAALRQDFLKLHPGAAARTVVIKNAGLADARTRDTGVLEKLGLLPGRYVLAVGRLEATKAFDVLLEAYRRTRRRDLKLVIVGGPGDRAYAQRLREAVPEGAVLAGARIGPELRDLYAHAALFIHPSHMEGYGLVVAEALSMNLPVVASDIAQHREFALNEASFYPAGDVDALAQRLSADDYGIYHSAEACSRESADSWERVAGEHLALLQRLRETPSRRVFRTGA